MLHAKAAGRICSLQKRREQKLLQLLWRTDCCQPPSVSLKQLSKLKLDNFSNVKKSSLLSKDGKSVILRADGNLFARLLVIGQSQKVDL